MLPFYPLRLIVCELSKGHAKIIASGSIGSISIMQANANLLLHSYCSPYSTTYSGHQHSPFMKKLLNKKGGKTTKKRWFEPYFKETLEYDAPKRKKGPSERHLTRLRQVSHVLYDKVSHIVNSGELCQEILEKQVNITSVKLHNNMNGINVFWDADRSDWEAVERLLDSKKRKLRSLLISYRVIGSVPPVTFVKAKQIYNLSLLNGLMDAADYGPDYVPGLTPNEISRQQREEEEESASSRQSISVDYVPLHLKVEGDNISQFSNLPEEEVEFQNSVMDCDGVEYGENPGQSVKLKQSIQYGENFTLTPSIETLNQVKDNDEDNHCDINVTPQMKFRSDLYGLKRGELLKKIYAKKKGLPSPENITQSSATIAFRLNIGSEKNAALVRELVNRKAKKGEKKRKAQLLDRDASEFF